MCAALLSRVVNNPIEISQIAILQSQSEIAVSVLSAIGLQSITGFFSELTLYTEYYDTFLCHVRGHQGRYHPVFLKLRSTEIGEKVYR